MDTVGQTILLYGGAIAGFIAFVWKVFETYAAKSKNTWDDKIVKIVNDVAIPIVKALEANTQATAGNSDHLAENTTVTAVNSEVTAPPKS